MATFQYNALTENDRLMQGVIEAASPEEATKTLEEMRLKVNSLEKAKPARLKTPISRSEFLLFNQQLATITKTGIPLERGLRELARDINSRPMRKLINSIADDLEAGVPIEEAFEKHRKAFPPLYGRILKAGVESGRLSEMLTSLSRNLEVSSQTRRIVFEAMAYPAVILAFAAVIISGVLVFIVPRFEEVITEMIWGDLPALTWVFFTISKNVFAFWSVLVLFVVAIVVLFALLSTSAAARRVKESIYLKIPVFGRLYHCSILSKLAESMAMLVAAGSDMPAVLRLASQASGSEKIILESEMLAAQIEHGTNIIEAGQFCRIIPRLFLYSIQLGSQRNELQDTLYNLGQMHAAQVRCWQSRLQTILLPVMLMLVGGFLFLSILAMFLPMIMVISALGGT